MSEGRQQHSSDLQPELIADYACICGEGPLWHPLEQRLYWVDIDGPCMFWYDPATGHHEMFQVGRVVGGSPSRPMARCCCSWIVAASARGKRAS